jgi:predicted permease
VAQLSAAAGYAGVIAASAGIAWACYRARHPRERGVLAGSAAGGAVALAAVPLAGALFGPAGLRLALLCAAVNVLATWALSYQLFASAGAAFPESYAHADGGRYRGEWKGMLKEGYGVYVYPSGARYEGEWRAGVKEGRGVYHFPKGGVYEGEWRGGAQAGVGVRTFGSGRVQAGGWEGGRLAAKMEEWQCALAVEGASEAAAAARGVRVGGGGWAAAARQLAAQPSAWAYAAAAGMVALGWPLTPTLDAATRQLAAAHAPLAALAWGLTLDLRPVAPQQVRAWGGGALPA